MNYGILFTSWGVGGVVGPMLAGRIVDTSGSYEAAFTVASVLLVFAVFLAMISYVSVSVHVSEGELTIKLGKGKR
jgi:OFA family oxalate/formate antiporter-like MFS transporter